jgi:hypothetical protein
MTRFDAERLYVCAAPGLFAPSGAPARSPERRFVQITAVFFNMPMLTIDTLESANPAETANSVRSRRQTIASRLRCVATNKE